MLLLVVQSEGDELGEARLVRPGEQRGHRGIDVLSVLSDLFDTWPGQEAAFGTGVPSARPPRSTS